MVNIVSLASCYHQPKTHKSGPPTREPPVLTPTQGLLRSGLTRQAREGGGEIKARGTSRGSHDASHDDQGQAGARRAPAGVEYQFPLWCKGGK